MDQLIEQYLRLFRTLFRLWHFEREPCLAALTSLSFGTIEDLPILKVAKINKWTRCWNKSFASRFTIKLDLFQRILIDGRTAMKDNLQIIGQW